MGHGSSVPQMYFPVQGTNKYGTTDFEICKSFRVDMGAQTDATIATENFQAGSAIAGFRVTVTEAPVIAGGSNSDIQLGFTGLSMLSAAATPGTLIDGYTFGPDHSADAAFTVLSADDTFDIIKTATAVPSAGKFDVDVFYYPPRTEDFDSSYKEWVTT